jgi:NAD-dependent DNA ligase
MNIDGLSIGIIKKLYELNKIKTFVDIYKLQSSDLEGVESSMMGINVRCSNLTEKLENVRR